MATAKSSTIVSLYEVYTNYTNGSWAKPDWQRDLVWNDIKQRGWDNSLRKGGIIPGVIIIFGIKGDETRHLFINDGMQRTLTTIHCVQSWQDSGLLPDQIQKILMSVKIAVQELEYDSEDEAFQDFFKINLGTVCTPFELGLGVLSTKLPNFAVVWKPLLEELHNLMADSMTRLGVKKTKNRDEQDKYKRDDLSTFYMFLAENPDNVPFLESGKKWLTQDDINDTLLESRFQKRMVELGSTFVKSKLNEFRRFLGEQSSLYETLWREYADGAEGFVPKVTHVRWWFLFAIWRQKKNVSVPWFQDFTKRLINMTQGTSAFYVAEDEKTHRLGRSNTNLKLSNLTILPDVCEQLQIDLVGGLKKPRRKGKVRRGQVKEGYHQSHVKAYSVSGPGDTVIEPALLNLSRGTRDMDNEEPSRKSQKVQKQLSLN